MALKLFELLSIVLLMIVGGLYWGPWVALSRSMDSFEPGVFLAIVKRMSRNMEPVMTVLMPVALVSTLPVLVLSFGTHRHTFLLTLAGLAMFLVTLFVTLAVEVPIVKQIDTWTEMALRKTGKSSGTAGGHFTYCALFRRLSGCYSCWWA